MLDVSSENVRIEYLFCSCSNRSIARPISISCLRFENLFPGPAEWKARLQDANKFYQQTQTWVEIPSRIYDEPSVGSCKCHPSATLFKTKNIT